MTKRKPDPIQSFMDQHMDTVLEIYRVFMRRATPPADAIRILRIIIAMEEELPIEDNLTFVEIRRIVAAVIKEGGK